MLPVKGEKPNDKGMNNLQFQFGSDFWMKKIKELGYPLNPFELDIPTLKESKIISPDFVPSKITQLTSDSNVEVALIEYDETMDLTRSRCTKTARAWRINRLIKPLLVFTNGKESYLVIVPGKGLSGEAKILGLSDRLYHTDQQVLRSITYPGTPAKLNENYDSVFLPYEKVQKDFFDGYRELYQRTEEQVRGLLPESTAYAQRFLGRVMFLYFLQKKGWLKNDKQYIDGIKDYRELNVLFYESLNTGNIPGIPFLNGSLFEREEYLDQERENKLYPVMDTIFKEARVFFNKYNFTVDESTPLDVQVSIDPTLIGTVFETMLPENERGSKGTFYTHRNEVSFICRRALANWLDSPDQIIVKPDGKEEFNDGLDILLKKITKNSVKEVRELKEKILSARVLDPAVGSGGFLLGMMQEMVGLIEELEAKVGWKTDPKELKENILRNLYGFDIESEAVEIARLRLWLSLIIDQTEPEALLNLDMNIVKINDSLLESQRSNAITQSLLSFSGESLTLRDDIHEIGKKYVNEHNGVKKKLLKERHNKLSEEFRKETGLDGTVIELYMHGLADMIVLNPPYVRQEAINETKKKYYVSRYGLPKRSDLFSYFFMRSYNLLNKDGVVSVISSDKWLETGYGVPLQKKLKDHIICVYGQKNRSFGADINTVITVYSKEKRGDDPVRFTYLDTYGGTEIKRSVDLNRKTLKPGKWFYLRAPKIFIEKILPKLTHTLEEYANIKRGFTTGANDFFYFKDTSHLYETDYLTNSQKLEEQGVTAKTQRELEEQGLIYIENSDGNRFVLNKKDIKPLIRSPRELSSYKIKTPSYLVFNPSKTSKPGKYSLKYIEWGEQQEVIIKRGKDKGKKIIGYNNLSTTKAHNPKWYNLGDLKPTKIISYKFINKRHFTPYSETPIIADHTCDMVYPKKISSKLLWIYMNSTIFYLIKELYGLRMGAGALQLLTNVVLQFPVFDIKKLQKIEYTEDIFNRKPLEITKEFEQKDRRRIDIEILSLMGFKNTEDINLMLYDALYEVVNDRLAKSGKKGL